ncbi:MAG: helix-turn-helix domain-containing protein [Bacteroidetes bacterium]|nr:helix-turn-helix domain-containing protein [Bacteroidota bacterium]
MKKTDCLSLLYSSKNSNTPSFEIKTLESLTACAGTAGTPAFNHHQFRIFWITRGAGLFHIDMQRFDILSGQLFCILPGEVHLIQSGEDLEGYVISFTRNFLSIGDIDPDMAHHPDGITQLFEHCKTIQASNDSIPDMALIMERLLKEYNSSDAFRLELLNRYFKIFLIYLSRQVDTNGALASHSRTVGLVQRFMDLLNHNFKEMRMVADYARQLAVTPNYLNESIKRSTGHPASYHIRQRIALEAKRQAAYSDVCMKEIAYYLGFSDSAHFSKFFKNTTGMNFTDFKKEKFAIPMAS